MTVSALPKGRDRILLTRIGVFAYHGVHEEEARLGQRFYISLDCRLDLSEAGREDNLEKSISYADLAMRVQEIACSERFAIIEALAETLAAALLAEFARLQEITVTVEKPGAAVPALLDTIAVAITRSREG